MKIFCLLLFSSLIQVFGECPKHCKCSRYMHLLHCSNASLTEIPHLVANLQVTLIDLSQNNIKELRNGTFQDRNIINVSFLWASYNNISTVESDAFRGLGEHLIELSLSDNPCIKLPDVGFRLETLMYLDLSFCNLKSIPASFFTGMPDITRLNLRANKLSFFDPQIIEPGKGLQLNYLDMEDNQFTKLQLKLVEYQKANLWMPGNPFHCDCEFNLTYSIYSQRNLPAWAQPVCATPPRFHGTNGSQLLKMNLQCDVANKGANGLELVAQLQDASWWYQHQWWLVTICALFVVIVVVVHVLQNHTKSFERLDRLWNSRKFTTLQNKFNDSENVLMD